MSLVTIKQFRLFEINENGVQIEKVNEFLEALINLKVEKAALRYDLQVKLAKAVEKAVAEFHEQRKKLLEDLAVKKTVTLFDGSNQESDKIVVDAKEDSPESSLVVKINDEPVEGKKILSDNYDVDLPEFFKKLGEVLDLDIPLECYPIKLSRLNMENIGDLNMRALEPFLLDDLDGQ